MISRSEPGPVIIIDTREDRRLVLPTLPHVIDTMPEGDYGIVGFSGRAGEPLGFAIERKSITDLVGSLTRRRAAFMREIERLRRYRFAAVMIEGHRAEVEMALYAQQVVPASILHSLDAIMVRGGVHVIWAGDRAAAAEQVESLAMRFASGIRRDYDVLARADRDAASGKIKLFRKEPTSSE